MSLWQTTQEAMSLLLSMDGALWEIIGVSFRVSLMAMLIAVPPALLIGTDEDSTSGDVRCWDWWTRTHDSSFVRPGLLWTYTDHPDRVLQCPAYAGEDNWQGPARPSGYNYNVTFIAAMTPLQGVAGQGCWDLLVPKPALAEEGEPPVWKP